MTTDNDEVQLFLQDLMEKRDAIELKAVAQDCGVDEVWDYRNVASNTIHVSYELVPSRRFGPTRVVEVR